MKPFHPTMKRNWFIAIYWRKPVSSNKFLSKKSFRGLFKVEVYQQLGDFSLGRGTVGGSATRGKCQFGDFNQLDFPGTIFILILLNKKNNTLNKINLLNKINIQN